MWTLDAVVMIGAPPVVEIIAMLVVAIDPTAVVMFVVVVMPKWHIGWHVDGNG